MSAFWIKRPRAISVAFSPELVYNSGSLACDFEYLAAFYGQTETAARAALGRLCTAYFGTADSPCRRTACKAHLPEVLHHMRRCLDRKFKRQFGQTPREYRASTSRR